MNVWSTQTGWRRCPKCRSLWLPGEAEASRCAAGGSHAADSENVYSLVRDVDAGLSGQMPGWRLCGKCRGLWFGPNVDRCICPSGGAHSLTGSPDYSLTDGSGPGEEGWTRCGKCQALCFGPESSSSVCPAGGRHAGELPVVVPPVNRRVAVHTKIVVPPPLSLARMFQGMRTVYAARGIEVEWASDEQLTVPEETEIVQLGGAGCRSTNVLSDEQLSLFAHRRFAGEGEIVAYFVEATDPITNGCSMHPFGRPGTIITSIATEWTLAHEIGHVLGLKHVIDDLNSLMTKDGTANITNPPPDMSPAEVQQLKTSPMVVSV